MLVGVAAVQISAFSIFLFEWLSPAGYDMKVSSCQCFQLKRIHTQDFISFMPEI